MAYEIVLTPTAAAMLSEIRDKRLLRILSKSIDALANDPEKRGKPLTADLSGLYSSRSVGQRYRIIYMIDQGKVVVLVVAVGLRKEGDSRDIYALARKLVRMRLLDPGDEP